MIGCMVVRVNFSASLCVILDKPLQSLPTSPFHHRCADLIALPILGSYNRRLPNGSPTSLNLLAGVFVTFLPTHEGLIYLHRTFKLPVLTLPNFPYSVG